MMPTVTILQGDCLGKLKELPDASVHCCVTSPPYWGLRDYGTATWEGGNVECNHRKGDAIDKDSSSTLCGTTTTQNHSQESWSDYCRKCGAKRIDRQLGLEKTPQEYVDKMVLIFREVRRVLRDDGTLWLNLGDSYNGNGSTCGKIVHSEIRESTRSAVLTGGAIPPQGSAPRVSGLKPKDLVGIPWRVAFALQADGWYLRSDIIWSKPNPMPESVTDRPTKAHEYIFLLSKNQRYYYDAESIKEPASDSYANDSRWDSGATEVNYKDGYSDAMAQNPKMPHRVFNGEKRTTVNKRTVWEVTTAPYPEAHFATYPPDLIKPCILAGCPVGGTVLDPFGGSGTTGMVALELGRNAILIELNPKYVELMRQRTNVTPGML